MLFLAISLRHRDLCPSLNYPRGSDLGVRGRSRTRRFRASEGHSVKMDSPKAARPGCQTRPHFCL